MPKVSLTLDLLIMLVREILQIYNIVDGSTEFGIHRDREGVYTEVSFFYASGVI
jgi:hypothetical protein